MKIGLVLTPLDEANLRLAAQIAAEEVVYYDMYGVPPAEELLATKKLVENFGLTMSVVEGGPPNNDIVLGKSGRDGEIENYKRSLAAMAKAGVNVLCYNFMPLSLRVARTSYETPERGGAKTNSFEMNRWDNARRTIDGETCDEQIWENLEYFLKRIVPTAEELGVKLAM